MPKTASLCRQSAWLIRIALFFICVFPVVCTYAQVPKAKVVAYGREDGLTHTSTADVLADSSGMLWILAGNTVLRYDGKVFHVPSLKGFPFAAIRSIHQSDDHQTWIISETGDIAIYDPLLDHFTLFPYNDELRQYTQNQQVSSIYIQGSDSSLWIGTRGLGLVHFSPGEGISRLDSDRLSFHGYTVWKLQGIPPLLFSNVDSSRIGEPFSFAYVDETGDEQFRVTLSDTAHTEPSAFIKRIDQSYLLATGGNSLISFTAERMLQVRSTEYSISGLLEDRRGGLWLGSIYTGVRYFPSGTPGIGQVIHYENTGFRSQPAAEDYQGGVWITSSEMGLLHIPTPTYLTYLQEQGENAYGPTVQYGDSLVLIRPTSLRVFQPGGTPMFREICFSADCDSIPGRPTGLLVDSTHHRLWLATDQGLYECDPQQATLVPSIPELAATNISDIRPGLEGLFVALDNDRFHVVQDRSVVFRSPPVGEPVLDVAFVDTNRYWVSTPTRLLYWNGDSLTNLSDRFPEQNLAFALLTYRDDCLWVAPVGEALQLIRGTTIYTPTYRGKPIRNVRSLVVLGKKRVLAIGMNGRAEIEIPEEETKEPTVQLFTQDFAVVPPFRWPGIRKNGFYYMGTEEGVYRFPVDPFPGDTLQDPRLVINRVSVNQQDTIVQPVYALEHDQNFLEVSFSVLSFQDLLHSPIVAEYRMIGLDTTWRKTKKQSLTYTTLPPGEYQLELRARMTGLNEGRTTRILFRIAPPFWQTWWFITLSLILLVLCIGAVFYLVFRTRHKQAKLEIEKLRAEQRALQAQMNPHFMYNALSSIQELVFQEDRIEAVSNIALFAQLMRSILNQSAQEFIPLSEEVQTLRIYLELEALRFEDRLEFHIEVDPSITLEACVIPPLLIQPFAENAIKHGLLNKEPAGGQLTLRFNKHERGVTCSVEDNGVGREMAAKMRDKRSPLHRSFGLQAVQDRIRLINSNRKEPITWSITDLYDAQKQPAGTRVDIVIPLN